MAIIQALPPSDEDDRSFDTIILRSERPALLIRGGNFEVDAADTHWSSVLERGRAILEKAIRSVGRLETADAASPFVGTAFMVDNRLAATADFTAKAIVRSRPDQAANHEEDDDYVQGAWLNFAAELGSDAQDRIAIRKVHFVHPYWGFAFLELEREVESTRVLARSPKISADELTGRDICVIGYPAADVRNDAHVVNRIFGGIFDVKRMMPGRILGTGRWGTEDSLSLRHDASTMGGTSGAPLIDIETGQVLALHVGGTYLEANYAVPAWEIDRDPQWRRAIKHEMRGDAPDPAAVRRGVIGVDESETPILTFEEVVDLHKKFAKIVGGDTVKIRTLFSGLPPEYVATLPDEGSPSDRLLLMLHAVNNTGGKIGAHSAFYYLLKNGEQMRNWDTEWKAEAEAYVAKLLEREKDRE